MITTEAMVAEEPKDEPADAGGGGMGGMGDMGGMGMM
jgi:chaperonin GroEL